MVDSSSSSQDEVPELIVEDAIATIRLRRPSCGNRIESADLAHLSACFAWLSQSPDIRALVITGTGKHFCTGYDLGSLVQTEDDGTEMLVTHEFARTVDALQSVPQVTVAAINGGVFGGAIDLALACDFRYGTKDTRMFVPAARLGLQYYHSGIRRYVCRLGADHARRLLLLGETYDAPTMLACGFLSRVVPSDELMRKAFETARTVAGMAPLAVSGMKWVINALEQNALDEAAARRMETRSYMSADLREGIAAWHEKRTPSFVAA